MSTAVAEQALIDAARGGETRAIERLLVVCQPQIRRYAQRSCFISDVDDGVQETLLVLSRYAGAIRHTKALSRWLFQVVRRTCRRLSQIALRHDPWEEARVDELVARRPPEALRRDVASAIESLPAHYREVIVLRDFEELTIGEMARRLELSRAAVKSRLHRARELAREYLLS
jgi:RNA polymerase sigma factor (sigma-70 family)